MDKHEFLVELCDQAKQAHIEAFQDTGGDDPDWPTWYAEYIMADLQRLFGAELRTEQVADLLVRADQEYQASGSQGSWMEYHAGSLLKPWVRIISGWAGSFVGTIALEN